MSAEQKYLQLVDSVKNEISMRGGQSGPGKKVKGCTMHPLPSTKCRKCKEILEETGKEGEGRGDTEAMFSSELPAVLRLNTENTWACFN